MSTVVRYRPRSQQLSSLAVTANQIATNPIACPCVPLETHQKALRQRSRFETTFASPSLDTNPVLRSPIGTSFGRCLAVSEIVKRGNAVRLGPDTNRADPDNAFVVDLDVDRAF